MLPEKYISYYFIKFIRPIWYFHLKPYNEVNNVWIEYEKLHKRTPQPVELDVENTYCKIEMNIPWLQLLEG